MAFLFQDQRSPYWQAGWKDEQGKRVNRSTRIPAKMNKRNTAQKVADAYEEAAKNKVAARHVRQVISDLHNRITGHEMTTATVREYVGQFMERKRGEGAKATVAFYQTATRDFLEWLGDQADRDMNDVRPADISGFRNHLLAKISETTVSNKIKAIRSMFSAAHKEGVCLDEPTASLKLSRKARRGGQGGGKRAFTVDELKMIKEASTGEWQSMIMFGLYTGQRLGDLATLRWSSVDLVREELRITTGKTGRMVVIPMSGPLIDFMENISAGDDPSGFLHPTLAEIYEGKGSSTLSNQFNSILASCGLREAVSHQSKDKGRDSKREETTVSFHSLRATAVTLLHEAGIPAATVEEWVGHDSAEVHKAYIKIGRETLKRASDALPKI